MDQWHVCESLPRAEMLAASELKKQGFQAIVPTFMRARKRRHQQPQGLVIPGYVFVSFNKTDDAWGCIRSTRGVRRLICWASGEPEALSEREGAWLVDQFGHGPVADLEAALLPFRVGARLRVTDGPFAGLAGTCERSSASVVRLVMSIFGRSTPFDFPATALEMA